MSEVVEKQIKAELVSMDKRLSDLEETIDSINGKVTQVVDAILGNSLTKQGGFIAEIDYLKKDITYLKNTITVLEKKQASHDLFKSRVIWTIGILVSLAVIIQYITTVYIKLKQT